MRFLLLVTLALQVPLGLDRGWLAPPDNPVTSAKADLGRELFFDRRLSVDGSLACADCHQPARGFTDGAPTGTGVGGRRGTRNTPTLVNRTYGRTFGWDGRSRTLEEQVLRPIEHPDEMAADLDTVVDRLGRDEGTRRRFEQVFGRPPDAQGVSFALATYLRTRLSGASAYDRYVDGDRAALDADGRRGFDVFQHRARCVTCHGGANFTDEAFHNTGVAWRPASGTTDTAPLDEPRDVGRFAVTNAPSDLGAFKTPTLREVARTAPYMHDGSLATLEDVVDFYDTGGQTNPYLDPKIRPLRLSADEKTALVAFLRTLSGQVTEGVR